MIDKEKKNKIADILLDFYDEYYSDEINRPMIPSIYAGKILDSLQEEPVIQNVITKPVGVTTGAVELANIPDKRSPTNEEIGDYDHKAVMESLYPQLKEEPTIPDIVDEHFYEMLGEDPVSEDFEEALAKEWKSYIDRGAATVDALEDNTQELAFAKGFYRGAKWQKEQMMTNAIDGEVLENCDGKVLEYDDSILDEKLSDCKVFDKVKVIIIKKD